MLPDVFGPDTPRSFFVKITLTELSQAAELPWDRLLVVQAYVTPWHRLGYERSQQLIGRAHQQTIVSPVWLQLRPNPKWSTQGGDQSRSPFELGGIHDLDTTYLEALKTAAQTATLNAMGTNSSLAVAPRLLMEGWRDPQQLLAVLSMSAKQLARPLRGLCRQLKSLGSDTAALGGLTLEVISSLAPALVGHQQQQKQQRRAVLQTLARFTGALRKAWRREFDGRDPLLVLVLPPRPDLLPPEDWPKSLSSRKSFDFFQVGHFSCDPSSTATVA